jgi:hypothetical protein
VYPIESLSEPKQRRKRRSHAHIFDELDPEGYNHLMVQNFSTIRSAVEVDLLETYWKLTGNKKGSLSREDAPY